MTKEQAKERAEIMLAWASGETIQFKFPNDEEWYDSSGDHLELDFNRNRYRIKTTPVWSLGRTLPGFRPLRDGEEWGCKECWDEGDLPNGWRPLLNGERAVESVDSTCVCGAWEKVVGRSGDTPEAHGYKFKTQRPLPEPVKMVPLEARDIPPGSSFRLPSTSVAWEIAGQMGGAAVCLYYNGWTSYNRLMSDGWEILRPGSTTWEKCEKEEVKP